MNLADDAASDALSRSSSRATRRKPLPSRAKALRERPPLERGVTDTFLVNEQGSDSPADRAVDENIQRHELRRRHTEGPGGAALATIPPERRLSRSNSEPHVDMDLAYGELPGDEPSQLPPPVAPAHNIEEQVELRQKMSKLTTLLDEANCVQHSVTAMIETLQRDPDALAAVALTLAEISTLARKVAPGVLKSLRATFPAAVALLASPQFMIAAGVGVGVTIVALGGYKIIKRIRANQDEAAAAAGQDEPLALGELHAPELSRIELWRRGIAEEHASSAGTTVDGEYVTPLAERRLIAEGVLDPRLPSPPVSPTTKSHADDDAKSRRSTATHRTSASAAPGRKPRAKSDGKVRPAKSVRSERSERTAKSSRSRSVREPGEHHHRHHHHHGGKGEEKEKEKEEKRRKPSGGGLAMLFKPYGS